MLIINILLNLLTANGEQGVLVTGCVSEGCSLQCIAAADEVAVADAALHVAALGDDQAVAATAVLRVKVDLDAVEARGGQRV